MNVALDGTPLTAGPGGIARYTAELHRALAECFPEDSFRLVSDQLDPPESWLWRRWWTFGIQHAIKDADVFHGTDFAVPYLPLKPSVMTVHDLSPWNGADASPRVRARTPYLIGLGLATMVITPSEAVRRAAIDYFRIPPSRVVATPLAAAPHLRPVETAQGNYFLFVGALEPRKNVGSLIAAWRAVRKQCAVDLVLAGRRRESFPAIPEEPGLRILGEVAEEDLAGLYSGAIACLYPSLYEGFGLPVLEAMQCGAAVIASRDPAIMEVAGGAAVLLDAVDVRGWIQAMRRAAEHPEWICEWRAKSLARAAEFSWERTARLTREVYQEARSRFG
jgi:glycosyltransferase involved in cell wall biosynthesis